MPLGLRNAANVASRYMKRKIQIESGLYHQDRGSYKNHLDEPCPIHENPKHTARQCRVLKKFCRPLTAAHRRLLNQESSPDHLAFQVAHTTISPNYPGEEFETLDARSWSSLQMYHRKMEKRTHIIKSVKTLTLPELFDDNKRS
jgi:hypothetical protein